MPQPPPGANADEVHAWWDSLTQDERDQLIAAHPPELGNLNGIPAEVRDQINTAVLNDDLSRPEDDVRYRNAVQVQQGLDHDRGADPGNQRPVLLWAYDPLAFDGHGRAAIAIGDPDYAEDIAVIVPGADSSVSTGWLAGGHNDAINLYDQSKAAYPADALSVIAWMGYDTPDGYSDPRIASPWLAREGGVRLAQDVNGLWSTHAGPEPHVTVLGHSYGSTTVADAFAAGGAHANDVILLGSPGTDLAHSAKDFHLDGGNVYVGSASSDPVSWLGEAGTVPNYLNEAIGYPLGRYAGLGTDPAGDGFGSVRFHAEVPGGERVSFRNHSHYYDLGGEALRSMAHIVTGHGGALAKDNLLAQGRRQPHITTPSEVNIPGLGPIHLPHIDTRIPGIPAYIDPEAERQREGAL
jgi:Alpha/beta hydrolase